jgi:hypothetical protein
MFPPTSRYNEVEIVKLSLRFLPDAAASIILAEHSVTEGDRLDNVTALYLGDPEQFWRVCDANNAMRPDDLMEIGRRLLIPLPQ